MKLFTVDQANRMLPLVRRIAEDIVRVHARWQDRVREYELLAASLRAGDATEGAEAVRRDIERLAAEIAGFVAELHALGVVVKGFDLGLVDFPSTMDGRTVYLCWHVGEPTVAHWHEIDAGFAGRRALDSVAVG